MSTLSAAGTKADAREVLDLLSDLSQLLLKWGWEGVVDYEEMVERVGRCYGYDDTTVMFQAQSAAIKLDGLITFVKVDIPGFPPLAYTQEIKDILSDIYAGRRSVADARAAINALRSKEAPYPAWAVWIGVVIISMGFAVEVTGTWQGVLWGGITAMVTGLVFIAADRVRGFGKVAQLVATMASGIISMIAYKHGWSVISPGLLLVASTFVFLPGDSISTQAYEVAEGRWSAGVDRLAYSIMTLVLMATGAYLAIVITGTSVDQLFPRGPHDAFGWWAVYPARIAVLIGILLTFHMAVRHFVPAAITLMIATAVGQATALVYGELAGTFFATMAGTVLAVWQSRKPHSIPAFVLIIPVIFALSPGSHGLRQFEVWVSGEKMGGIQDLQTVAGVLLAIAIGMVVGRVIARRWSWLRHAADA